MRGQRGGCIQAARLLAGEAHKHDQEHALILLQGDWEDPAMENLQKKGTVTNTPAPLVSVTCTLVRLVKSAPISSLKLLLVRTNKTFKKISQK